MSEEHRTWREAARTVSVEQRADVIQVNVSARTTSPGTHRFSFFFFFLNVEVKIATFSRRTKQQQRVIKVRKRWVRDTATQVFLVTHLFAVAAVFVISIPLVIEPLLLFVSVVSPPRGPDALGGASRHVPPREPSLDRHSCYCQVVHHHTGGEMCVCVCVSARHSGDSPLTPPFGSPSSHILFVGVYVVSEERERE